METKLKRMQRCESQQMYNETLQLIFLKIYRHTNRQGHPIFYDARIGIVKEIQKFLL